MQLSTIVAMVLAAMKSAWTGGSPFAVQTVLYPPNEDRKYVIESEGIRLAFVLHGGSLSNLWINDTNGMERDIVMGFDHADDYLPYMANPYLNGVIGTSPDSMQWCSHVPTADSTAIKDAMLASSVARAFQ